MSITRVHYRERQPLTAADLRFEQEYRLGMGGRHHLAHHDWGIVRGLRVVQARNGVFKLTPGVAIDGYGREILVPTAVEIEIDGFDEKSCWFLLLDYCEDPEQVPPGRRCKDEPAPRIQQRTAWRLTDSFVSPPESADDFTRARAAGRMAGLPPWPVLVATIGTGCDSQARSIASLIHYSRTIYVSHRASTIRSPAGGALVQLGLSDRTDVYHFLVSTRSTALAPSKRMGIDRDRTLHVWRPLVIAGTRAYGEVAIGHSLKLQITTLSPAGIGRRVRINGRYDAELQTLSASLLDLGTASASPRPPLQGSVKLEKNSVVLPLADRRSVSFRLLDAAKLQPIGFADARRRFRRAHRRAHRRAAALPIDANESERAEEASLSAELKPTGGKLALRKLVRPSETEDVPCGDVDRTRGATMEQDTPVVQFKPASEIEADPLAREIHAVATSKPTDAVPSTELRISGGAADGSDVSSRISIGTQIAAQYVPAMRMDGGRRVEILAAQTSLQDDPLVEVTDTVYLPAIGKKDPLLPDLLALAFIGGLRRIGNVTTDPMLELLPDTGSSASVVRGATLAYKLKISGTPSFTIKRTFELITGESGTGDMSFRTLQVPAGTASPHTVRFEVPRFTRTESRVAIQVLMLVQRRNITRVAVTQQLPVDLTDT